MKKLCILLILAIISSLCACNESTTDAPPAALDVHITAGKIEAGMTVKDILVEVTIDHQPVACTTVLTCFTSDGYYDMAEDEPVPENFFGRLNVYYSLPEGIDVDHLNVTMDCDGGEYDGTGSVGFDDEGNVEAWSHAIYGEEPAAEIKQVHISIEKPTAGMTLDQIKLELTLDEKPLEYTLSATLHSETGFRDFEPNETIPENFFGQIHIYYYLDQGITLDDIEVTADCPGGKYNGTGSRSDHADGRVGAWSHILYGTPEQLHDHDWKEDASASVPATCTEPGYIAYTCECGETTQESLSATGHNYTEDPSGSVAATCTTDGYSLFRCACGESYQEAIPAYGHNFVEDPSQSKAATCLQTGYKTYVCTCGETQQETLSRTGHTLKTTSNTSPTCTSPGYLTQHCTHCGAEFIDETAPTGHSWSDWTYYSGRYHEHTCITCGETEQASHSVPSNSVTCTGCGYDIIN